MQKDFCLDIENGIYRVDKMITTSLTADNKEPVTFPPLDPEHPYRPVITGTVKQTVCCNGESRDFLLYIPKDFPVSGPSFFVFPDDGMTAQEYLKQEGKQLADELRVTLVILEARAGGWDQRDIQSEVSYAEAVFNKANNRNYVGLNEPTYYSLGLGSGAYVSTAYTILNSATFAALLADGDFHLKSCLLEQLKQTRSDRNAMQKKTDVPMVSWLSDTTDSADREVLDTLLHACNAADQGLHTDMAQVFQQDIQTYQHTISSLPIAEVRYTAHELRKTLCAADLHRAMMQFALRIKRWLGIGNGQYRAAATYQQMGLLRVEKKIDGLLREWYVYVPSAYRMNPEIKRPLVIGLHGYSNTGVMYAGSSDWAVIAEERGFFAVFPTGYPSGEIGPNTVPLPAWNSTLDAPEQQNCYFAHTNDVQFILDMLQDMENTYPIDTERVYVAGHSNGSLLTQKLMDEVPQKFAAFGPQAGPYHLGLDGKQVNKVLPEDGIIRPVWLIMGHEDIGDGDSLAPDSTNTRFIDMMCHTNHLDRTKDSVLVNGKLTTHTFVNEQGVPLLKFTGIEDMPHCYTPELAHMVWDSFFCHFKRHADGTIEYIY